MSRTLDGFKRHKGRPVRWRHRHVGSKKCGACGWKHRLRAELQRKRYEYLYDGDE